MPERMIDKLRAAQPAPKIAEPVDERPPQKPIARHAKPHVGKKEREHREFDKAQRLPGGSRFVMDYDAEKVEWSGTLTIGHVGPMFHNTTSGVLGLCKELDRAYREHLKQQPTSPPSTGG